MVFFLCLLVSFAVTLVVMPLVIRLSVQRKLGLDLPNGRKTHKNATPRIGGIGLALGVFISIPWLVLDKRIIVYLLGAAVIFIVGLLDDLKEVGWKTKIVGTLIAASLAIFFADLRIESLGNLFGAGDLELGMLSIPITYLCILGITNAINMIDGLNGLASGVSIIAFAFLAYFSYLAGDMALLSVNLVFIGGASAFLIYNFPRGRIFLGDSGSLLLGFSLAVISVALFKPGLTSIEPMVPVLILAVPIFDTLRVLIKRVIEGKNPFHADMTHLHHLMLRCSRLSCRSITRTIWAVSVVFGIAAVLLRYREGWYLLIILLTGYMLMTVFLKLMVSTKMTRGKVRIGGDSNTEVADIPIKVAILGTRGIPARHGGFETFAEEISVRLVKRGFDVTVFCEFAGKESPLAYRGVDLVYVRAPKLGPLTTIFFDLFSLLRARKEYDVVYMLGYGASIFCFIPRLWGSKVILNMDGVEWARGKWNNVAKVYFRIMEAASMWTVDHLVVDAKGIFDHISSRHRRLPPCSMIPYGADLLFSPTKTAMLDEFGLSPDKYFLVVCRLEEENHVLEIIQGFVDSSCDVPLIVVGGTERKTPYIKKLIGFSNDPRIRFIGSVYNRDKLNVLRYYALAYLHGHSVGGTNPSLLESLGAGGLVIAHENCFNREVAGKAAFYFKNTEGITRIIDRIISGEYDLKSMKNEALNIVAKKYNWEMITDQYELLFNVSLSAERFAPDDVSYEGERRFGMNLE